MTGYCKNPDFVDMGNMGDIVYGDIVYENSCIILTHLLTERILN